MPDRSWRGEEELGFLSEVCRKPAIGGSREGEEHEWVLFLRDPSVVCGLGQEAQQADQGGDAGGPDQGGDREEGYLEGGADRNQGELGRQGSCSFQGVTPRKSSPHCLGPLPVLRGSLGLSI